MKGRNVKPNEKQIFELIQDESEELVEVDYSSETEYKYVTHTTVFLHKESNTYWEHIAQYTNVGHWGDPDKISETITEVKPVVKMVEVIEWKAI